MVYGSRASGRRAGVRTRTKTEGVRLLDIGAWVLCCLRFRRCTEVHTVERTSVLAPVGLVKCRVRAMNVSPARLRMSDCRRCVTSETVERWCSKVCIPGRCYAQMVYPIPSPCQRLYADQVLSWLLATRNMTDDFIPEARRASSGRAVLIRDGSCQAGFTPSTRRPDPCASFREVLPPK